MEQEKKLLHWVRGNILRLAIPLEQEIITEEQTTREDYVVQSDDVVTVNLVSSSRRYIYAPKSIEGNVVSIEDNGELDLGTYGVEVLLSKADGTRLRSFWNYLIKIHNTNDAVLEEWDEFADVSGEILDSAIFFFAKGDPFTYEDFTQEQLDEIKRPALEAANVATQAAQSANNAATNANNAKDATIIATNLANSATQNADDAASSANSAAISANQAKRNADTATINANNAADAATQAAEIATESANNADIATDKTNDAIAQAQRAAVIGSNPDFIGSDYYVYKYNARLGRYERSNIYVRGENGDKGEKGDKGDKGDAGTTDYNLLENKPTRVSQFDNDADYATESFVNSSIATATATYRGSFNLVTDLGLSVGASITVIGATLDEKIPVADNNDYCFVQIPVANDKPMTIVRIERYKHNGSGWLYEYTLNNSGFTAEQWDAINSGVTSGDVDKLSALPTSAQLTSLLNGKQDTINDLGSIRSGASAGATAYQLPQSGVPEADLSQGVKDKLNEKEVFVAEYGVTTYQEIQAADTAGKLIVVHKSNNNLYSRISYGNNEYAFGCLYYNSVFEVIIIDNTRGWVSLASYSNEPKSNKKNTIVGNESSDAFYPTTKAVADYVATECGNKQDVLVSGTNIKTINNNSLLGSGNITIKGGSGSDNHALKINSNSVFINNNINDTLQSDRIIPFSDIRNVTVVIRSINSGKGVNHYSFGIVLGLYQSEDTSIRIIIDSYNLIARQYINGDKVKEVTLGNIGTLGINSCGDFAVLFDKDNMIIRAIGYDVANQVVVERAQLDISDWDLSSFVSVYLKTSVREYATYVCCNTVLLNSPSLLTNYLFTPLYTGCYNAPQGTEYNENLFYNGTGIMVGGTIIESISDTHKVVSVSMPNVGYFQMGPSNLDERFWWWHLKLTFTSVDTGAYFTFGVMAKEIIIEHNGITDTILDATNLNNKFYPIVGETYDVYYHLSTMQTFDYQRNYGIRAYGNMTFEIYEPYMFNSQVQNVCAETYNGDAFTGAIPFSGSIVFVDYNSVAQNNATSNAVRTPMFTTIIKNNQINMWNGTEWKVISQ